MYTVEMIEDMFTYHAPTPDQLPKYEKLRSAAREFAKVLVETTPESPDQSAAMRLLRQCVMQGNAAIALGGNY